VAELLAVMLVAIARIILTLAVAVRADGLAADYFAGQVANLDFRITRFGELDAADEFFDRQGEANQRLVKAEDI
jgi:hypothetical protein